ncbi:DUF3558 domain-containing protein [Kibdelosporangium philippinense]|uniref:DUF3558 domain-containing protein n=1 Tax=Kibdelosporangium philippinense TaxID=211113 RepID=UPI00362283B8
MRFIAIAAVVTAVGAAGCTPTDNGIPTPQAGTTGAQSTTASASKPKDYGAPRVTTPLDASKFLSQPCTVLTPAQLQSLTLPVQGKPDTDSQVAKTAGPSCLWINNDTPSFAISIGFLTGNKRGLSDTYRGHEQGAFPGYFEPTSVDGYPAVFNDLSDGRAGGDCTITVGVSDTLTLRVSHQGSRFTGAAACDRAKQAAALGIQTLRAGA